MSTSTWSRLRWPFKALIIAAPIIGLGYLATTNDCLKIVLKRK
jgi:hypothetical protein